MEGHNAKRHFEKEVKHMRYVALMRLKHSKTGEYIQAGSPVDLSHLTYDYIEMLKAKGAVAEMPDEPQEAPRTRRSTITSEAEG
jgi:hypothetical protein